MILPLSIRPGVCCFVPMDYRPNTPRCWEGEKTASESSSSASINHHARNSKGRTGHSFVKEPRVTWHDAPASRNVPSRKGQGTRTKRRSLLFHLELGSSFICTGKLLKKLQGCWRNNSLRATTKKKNKIPPRAWTLFDTEGEPPEDSGGDEGNMKSSERQYKALN